MAISNARRLVKQWCAYDSSQFRFVDGNPSAVLANEGTLLWDLFELSKKPINDWYPEFRKDKLRKPEDKKCRDSDYPEWSQSWSGSVSATKTVFQKYGNRKPKHTDFMNTYWLENRRRFRVLEKLDRCIRRLDIVMSKSIKRGIDAPNSQPDKRRKRLDTVRAELSLSQAKKHPADGVSRRAKKQKIGEQFSCCTKKPVRAGITPNIPCWICGYRILGNRAKRSFECCTKVSHIVCWKRQFIIRDKVSPLGGARCSDVVTYLKKDRMTADSTASPDKKEQANPFIDACCDICNTSLENVSSDNNAKGHYLKVCPGIPGDIMKAGATRLEILERVAALSLVKRLGQIEKVSQRLVHDVFKFSRRKENAGSSIVDGQQRSIKEPPD